MSNSFIFLGLKSTESFAVGSNYQIFYYDDYSFSSIFIILCIYIPIGVPVLVYLLQFLITFLFTFVIEEVFSHHPPLSWGLKSHKD